MNRRAFLRRATGLLALAELGAAAAQSPSSVRRIGWLMFGEPPSASLIERRNAPLRQLGWIEGQNLVVERRSARGSSERLQQLADELVGLDVDLIVTHGTNVTLAARKATATIPIVMYSSGDPVAAGLVASLARPGGNVTGISLVSPGIDAKRLSLLRELLPAAQRIGELVPTTNPIFGITRGEYEQVYRSLGLQPIFVGVARASEIEAAVANVAAQHAQALRVPNDDLFVDNRDAVIRAASKYALPTIVDRDALLEAGGLLSYTFSEAELLRRGAAFVDRILRGAKPADLPVEQLTQFELGINLKTAGSLGIVVPQGLLSRADRVIQ